MKTFSKTAKAHKKKKTKFAFSAGPEEKEIGSTLRVWFGISEQDLPILMYFNSKTL